MRIQAFAVAILVAASAGYSQAASAQTYLTTGILIGAIEEGARIFPPARLLPFNHPEALGHEFPTALQLHRDEDRLLVQLGQHAGLRLSATLQRYPTQPDTLWPAEAVGVGIYHFAPSGWCRIIRACGCRRRCGARLRRA